MLKKSKSTMLRTDVKTKDVVKRKKRRKVASNVNATLDKKHGVLTKKAKTLLGILDHYNFDPAKEFVNLWCDEKYLFEELLLKVKDPTKRTQLTKEETAMFKHVHTELKESLKTVFRFSYPTLKAIDVGSHDTKPISLKITVPVVQQQSANKPLVDSFGKASNVIFDIPHADGGTVSIDPTEDDEGDD